MMQKKLEGKRQVLIVTNRNKAQQCLIQLQEYKNMVEERLKNHRRIVNERKRIDEREDKDKDEIVLVQAAARDRRGCLVKKKIKEV